jgi:hypothetical protein
MTGENIFEVRARAAADARKRRLGTRVVDRLPVASPAELVRDAKRERDRAHQGTMPGQVLGEGAGQLCADFIDFKRKYEFSGAVELKDRGLPPPAWSIKGYGVGCYVVTTFWGGPFQTKLAHNVFLCEDGQLRTYTSDQIWSEDCVQPERTKIKVVKEYVPSLDQGGRIAEELFPEPCVIADLPVNDRGNTYIPSIGHFAQGRVSASYETSSPVYMDTATVQREYMTAAAYDYVHFVPEDLEALLTNYATGQARPSAPYYER